MEKYIEGLLGPRFVRSLINDVEGQCCTPIVKRTPPLVNCIQRVFHLFQAIIKTYLRVILILMFVQSVDGLPFDDDSRSIKLGTGVTIALLSIGSGMVAAAANIQNNAAKKKLSVKKTFSPRSSSHDIMEFLSEQSILLHARSLLKSNGTIQDDSHHPREWFIKDNSDEKSLPLLVDHSDYSSMKPNSCGSYATGQDLPSTIFCTNGLQQTKSSYNLLVSFLVALSTSFFPYYLPVFVWILKGIAPIKKKTYYKSFTVNDDNKLERFLSKQVILGDARKLINACGSIRKLPYVVECAGNGRQHRRAKARRSKSNKSDNADCVSNFSHSPDLKFRSIKQLLEKHYEEKGGPEFAKWFMDHGKMLVIEHIKETEIFGSEGLPGYRNITGLLGGLHITRMQYVERVTILIDSFQGCYGANNLHNNSHYQVYFRDLGKFMKDLNKMGYDIETVEEKTINEGSECNINMGQSGDNKKALIYTPLSPAAVNWDVRKNEDNADFFVIGDYFDNDADIQNEIENMKIDDLCNLIMEEPDSKENVGMKERNQCRAMNYGYSGMNCTDTSRPELRNKAAPKVTTKYDLKAGWMDPGKSNKSSEIVRMMVSLSKIMKAASSRVGLNGLLQAKETRNNLWSYKIHEENVFESITAAVTDLLFCHVDRMNGQEPYYSWNFSVYKYVRNKNVPDSDPQAFHRIHIGGYS